MVRLPTSCWLSRRWWSLVRQGDGQTRLGFQLGPLGIQTPLDRAPALPVSSLEFKNHQTKLESPDLEEVNFHQFISCIAKFSCDPFFFRLETKKNPIFHPENKTDSLLCPLQ